MAGQAIEFASLGPVRVPKNLLGVLGWLPCKACSGTRSSKFGHLSRVDRACRGNILQLEATLPNHAVFVFVNSVDGWGRPEEVDKSPVA
jgi:hypothetical protein